MLWMILSPTERLLNPGSPILWCLLSNSTADMNALKRRWIEWKSAHSNKENLIKCTEEKT